MRRDVAPSDGRIRADERGEEPRGDERDEDGLRGSAERHADTEKERGGADDDRECQEQAARPPMEHRESGAYGARLLHGQERDEDAAWNDVREGRDGVGLVTSVELGERAAPFGW